MVTPTPVPTINDENIAVLRTAVPVFVGVLLTFLARWIAQRTGYQWNLSGATEYVSPIAVAAVAALYYKVVTFFSKKQPKFGWLLGYPATPAYNTAAQTTLNGFNLSTRSAGSTAVVMTTPPPATTTNPGGLPPTMP